MEKTPRETYEVVKEAAEKAGGNIVSLYSSDLLKAFEYLEGPDKPKSSSTPTKIES